MNSFLFAPGTAKVLILNVTGPVYFSNGKLSVSKKALG